MKLRSYQLDALQAIRQRLGPRRGIVAHATGLGKTVLAAAWIAEVRTRDPAARVLFLAHRDELITQAVSRLGEWIDPASVGVVKAERNEVDKPVIVASVQSLARESRFHQLRRAEKPTHPFDALVIDECHHAAATTYQRILDWLGELVPTLGLSATPHRMDGRGFGSTWNAGILHEITLREGIQRGYLADLRTARISLDGGVEWDARVRRGDYVEADLESCFRAGGGAERIAGAILEHAAGRSTIVFTPTVATAQETDAACQSLGLTSTCIYGDMMPVSRGNGIFSYLDGRTSVLTNCAVLTEGFDAPRTSCIVIARPTRSRGFYLQMLGRGTRKFPGKDDCLVLDLTGASALHGDMQNVASVLGLPYNADLAEQSVAEVFATQMLYKRATANELREAVPLWQARPYAWVNTAVGYALGLGQEHGTLLLREHPLLGWAVYQLARGQPRAFVTKAHDLEAAQNVAEDLVKKLAVDKLTRKDEGWRKAKASRGQLDALMKLGHYADRERMRRGEAADALTKTITEMQWRR